MNKEKLRKIWLSEEANAHMQGWDFSHILGRYKETGNLPWNYRNVIHKYLKANDFLLDIDTGGGEFLLSLKHLYHNTSATEGYLPNVTLCKNTLLPLGIDFREMSDYDNMPFKDNSFDIIINRHGKYNVSELYRTLKINGLFITQQVGCENDRELVDLLCPGVEKPFPDASLKCQSELFEKQGFKILQAEQSFRPIRFFDTGALVWFAKIIEWEFINFSVDSCFDNLLKAECHIQQNGYIEGTTHRYLIVAQK